VTAPANVEAATPATDRRVDRPHAGVCTEESMILQQLTRSVAIAAILA
jgi:hypothetical protein